LIGLFGVITKRNLIKMIVSIVICEYAVNLFAVVIAYKNGGEDPLIVPNAASRLMVDPLPQSFALLSIMSGLALLLVLISICIRLYEKYGTLDITKIRHLKG
jgi:multisubunit Na+/H+ antiporter MnhC subunit